MRPPSLWVCIWGGGIQFGAIPILPVLSLESRRRPYRKGVPLILNILATLSTLPILYYHPPMDGEPHEEYNRLGSEVLPPKSNDTRFLLEHRLAASINSHPHWAIRTPPILIPPVEYAIRRYCVQRVG